MYYSEVTTLKSLIYLTLRGQHGQAHADTFIKTCTKNAHYSEPLFIQERDMLQEIYDTCLAMFELSNDMFEQNVEVYSFMQDLGIYLCVINE